MATTQPAIRPHTKAMLAVLALTGKPVGDAEAPDGAGWVGEWGASKFVPYVVLVEDDVKFDGPIGDPVADAVIMYRVLSIGMTRDQASWMADRARETITAPNVRAVGIPGRRLMGTVWTGTGGTQRDDSTHPPLYVSTDTYTLRTTTP